MLLVQHDAWQCHHGVVARKVWYWHQKEHSGTAFLRRTHRYSATRYRLVWLVTRMSGEGLLRRQPKLGKVWSRLRIVIVQQRLVDPLATVKSRRGSSGGCVLPSGAASGRGNTPPAIPPLVLTAGELPVRVLGIKKGAEPFVSAPLLIRMST